MQDGSDQNQPGNIVQPGSSGDSQLQSAPSPVVSPEVSKDRYEASAKFRSDVDDNSVSWSASEFIAHQKSASWYIVLAVGAVLAAAIIYILSRDKISTVMIIIVAASFGFFASRKPRTLQYMVDEKGISIGSKLYPYELFKSFAIMDEGAFSSLVLLPLKRFMPSISVYCPPDNEDDIVDILGAYLPEEQLSHDMLDRLLRKVRF